MKERIFHFAGSSDALAYATAIMQREGCRFSPEPDQTVTHLLLDIPHRAWDSLPATLSGLSPSVTVVGGNLNNPLLAGCKTIDLLQDPIYLAENANITAHCAIKLLLAHLPVTLHRCPVLIIGWGRIGKCLARLLKQMDAYVTVAARKEADRAMLLALGYNAVDIQALDHGLEDYRVILNTVPAPVLTEEAAMHCRADCLKLELASLPGITGKDIIAARGLPNRGAPESSGDLIARSILRLS